MPLSIKDGLNVTQTLATETSGADLVPIHTISGSVSVIGTSLTASIANQVLSITSSQLNPVYVTGGILKTEAEVSNSQNTSLWITSSKGSPVFVVSDYDKPVFVENTAGKPLFVTSSQGEPLIVKNIATTVVGRQKFASGFQIDWASASPANISGTFILADSSSQRSGLMFANNTKHDLYVAIGGEGDGKVNGFLLSTTSSAPIDYSFILYPSGTYSADPGFVNSKHTGFFISSSYIDVTVTVTTTV